MESAAVKRPAGPSRVSGVMRNLPTVNGVAEKDDIEENNKRALGARIHGGTGGAAMGHGDIRNDAVVRLAKRGSLTTVVPEQRGGVRGWGETP